jgi:hypothetical protein
VKSLSTRNLAQKARGLRSCGGRNPVVADLCPGQHGGPSLHVLIDPLKSDKLKFDTGRGMPGRGW